MEKFVSRLTSSARGEVFNPLIWPALFTTTAYGLGLGVLFPLGLKIGDSSLYSAMTEIGPHLPLIWGITALVTIFTGIFFLLFNKPPMGKFSGLLGFMVWLFACFCFAMTDNYFVLAAVAFPNAWFWFWQYLSLSQFRKQDVVDNQTMEDYDEGLYDDENNPETARHEREGNRDENIQ